jgi:voltage-gated potassium channel
MLGDRLEVRLTAILAGLTLRKAIGLIVATASILAFAAAILVRVVDPAIGTFGDALWWAVSTVTTVGYGDVVPTSTPGRVAGTILMLTGIALIPLITSVVVAVLVERRSREARAEELRDLQLILQRFDELEDRLGTR